MRKWDYIKELKGRYLTAGFCISNDKLSKSVLINNRVVDWETLPIVWRVDTGEELDLNEEEITKQIMEKSVNLFSEKIRTLIEATEVVDDGDFEREQFLLLNTCGIYKEYSEKYEEYHGDYLTKFRHVDGKRYCTLKAEDSKTIIKNLIVNNITETLKGYYVIPDRLDAEYYLKITLGEK